MPFKYDAAGNLVTTDATVGGKTVKLPVFIHSDNTEAGLDGDGTIGTIARLNGEAKQHREAKEAAEALAKKFDGLDAASARKALETVKNLDDKKLIDAGEVEKLKAAVASALNEQITTLKSQLEAANSKVTSMTIGSVFTDSKFIKDKTVVPADMMRALFGANFKLDDAGQIYAVDNSGNKLYSKTSPGSLATSEEALDLLVGAYAHRDTILKGTGGSGGGTRQGPLGAGGKRVMTRSQFDALPAADKMKTAAEVTIVD
jgi:hypothetical protein